MEPSWSPLGAPRGGPDRVRGLPSGPRRVPGRPSEEPPLLSRTKAASLTAGGPAWGPSWNLLGALWKPSWTPERGPGQGGKAPEGAPGGGHEGPKRSPPAVKDEGRQLDSRKARSGPLLDSPWGPLGALLEPYWRRPSACVILCNSTLGAVQGCVLARIPWRRQGSKPACAVNLGPNKLP